MTDTPPPTEPAESATRLGPLLRTVTSIRTRLLVVNVVLVLVPLVGVQFARVFELRLLGQFEAETATAATLLAGTVRSERGLTQTACDAAMLAGTTMPAHVRLLSPAGDVVCQSDPEAHAVVTRGRELTVGLFRKPQGRRVVVTEAPDLEPPRSRPEVQRALATGLGFVARIPPGMRGVRLYRAVAVQSPEGGAPLGVVYVARSTYPVLVELYRVRNGLIAVAALSLAGAVAVALYLGLSVARPLRRLTRAAQRIAAGERGVQLQLSGHDEIGTLARAFDRMAREIDARLRYVTELAANVSHEFKTPIASIRGAAELLSDGAAEEPEARARFLSHILSDADRLSRLVSRLLELSRIEALRAEPLPVDLRALVDTCVARSREAGGSVQLAWESTISVVRAHDDLLETALGNLLENALRHGVSQQPVTVRVTSPSPERVRIAVQDQGPGVSAANLSRVWDRFFTTARASGGTGLGLSIVRAIADVHGGSVGAESSPGRGACFWIELPRDRGRVAV